MKVECANFVRLKTDIDVRPLLAELQKADPKVWREDTYLRDYPQGPFGDTESIIFRFPPRTVHETEKAVAEHLANFDQHENVWQPVAKDFPEFRKVVFKMAHDLGATRIGRVMLNKLNPGGRIYAHADTPVHAEYWCRFHIVVGALEGSTFRCGDVTESFTTGDVFFFRNELEHEVHNTSAAPRLHLVMDFKIEDLK